MLGWAVPVVAAAVATSRQTNVGVDAQFFVHAGRTLLSAHWGRAFSDSGVQAGPLQLLLYGSLGRSPLALAFLLATATALLLIVAARVAGVLNPVLLAGVGLLGVRIGLTGVGYAVGHPADAILPLVWVIAAAEARRGHARWAGLLVGLTAGLETWGILGVAVLALAPRRRQAGEGVLVAVGTALALFLPFVIAGHFAMFAFRWHVRPPSPLSLLVGDGTVFGWPLRLAQGALAVGAGVAVAWLLRRSPHALWTAPLAVVVIRLQFDPVLFQYYLAGPEGPILVGVAVGASRSRVLQRLSGRGIHKESLA